MTTQNQLASVDLKTFSNGEVYCRYLESIQSQRGDFNRQVLSIRGEDLRALAVIHESTPDDLLDELRANGAISDA
jgi:phosphoribosylpyrophosphate synthetase